MSEVHKVLLQWLPTCICGKIWKSRCKARFEYICLRACAKRNGEMIYSRGWLGELNVDGCSKGNTGVAGSGGIIRNHVGHNMIMAFASSSGICSNNVAAKAILQGMSMCIDNGFHKTIVESDSTLMVDIIYRKNNIPWQIHNIIQIWSLMHTEFFLFFSHLQERKRHCRSDGQFGCYRQTTCCLH